MNSALIEMNAKVCTLATGISTCHQSSTVSASAASLGSGSSALSTSQPPQPVMQPPSWASVDSNPPSAVASQQVRRNVMGTGQPAMLASNVKDSLRHVYVAKHNKGAAEDKVRYHLQAWPGRWWGRNERSPASLTRALLRTKWEITWKLEQGATENEVRDHLQDNGIAVSRVSLLEPKTEWQKRWAAFRGSGAYSCTESVFNADLWPTDV